MTRYKVPERGRQILGTTEFWTLEREYELCDFGTTIPKKYYKFVDDKNISYTLNEEQYLRWFKSEEINKEVKDLLA